MAGRRSWLPLESFQPRQSCHPALLPSTLCCQTKARQCGVSWGCVCCWLPCSSPGWALHRQVPVLAQRSPWLLQPLLGQAGLAWGCPTYPLAALAVLGCELLLLPGGAGAVGWEQAQLCPSSRAQAVPTLHGEDGSTPDLGLGWGQAGDKAHALGKPAAGFKPFLNQLTSIASSAV